MRVAIIGGGAAGFFAAISCMHHHADAEVVIYEKSSKLLAKVKISGGGRCNVTHACFNPNDFAKFYPRGQKFLKKALRQFNAMHTVKWFESRGVPLKTEADNRMFPQSDNSQSIIDCLLKETTRLKIGIKYRCSVNQVLKNENSFDLITADGKITVDKVIVACGGSPKLSSFGWLQQMGHSIEAPLPSLFTFNMPNEPIKSLMGLVADPANVSIQGAKLSYTGPVLITHWGMSGPAVLKLSAFGARVLNAMDYSFQVQVNWLGLVKENELRERVQHELSAMAKRQIANRNPFNLPNRLWSFLLDKVSIPTDVTWGDLGKKNLNKLVNVLMNDVYSVKGKTTFKEEFVTCGGIKLNEVDVNSMQSKICPGLYFAGEVLDIDGITGGFNFQAAWTTGFIAGKLNE